MFQKCVRAGALHGAVMLKLPAGKVGDRGFEPHSGLQISKKQNVSSPSPASDEIRQIMISEIQQGFNAFLAFTYTAIRFSSYLLWSRNLVSQPRAAKVMKK